MELTKEHFDDVLKTLATKNDLQPIKTTLAAVMEIASDHTSALTAIQHNLNEHSTTLDTIAKNTSNWESELTIMRDRVERHENALKLLAGKLGVDIATLLH
jgi:septation ring formation regulator EzrA